MNIILLSGGSGKRLWPLSNDVRSKQFIRLLKKPEPNTSEGTRTSGEYESMVQRVFRQIKKADPDAVVTIATSKSQVSALHNQLIEVQLGREITVEDKIKYEGELKDAYSYISSKSDS